MLELMNARRRDKSCYQTQQINVSLTKPEKKKNLSNNTSQQYAVPQC